MILPERARLRDQIVCSSSHHRDAHPPFPTPHLDRVAAMKHDRLPTRAPQPLARSFVFLEAYSLEVTVQLWLLMDGFAA